MGGIMGRTKVSGSEPDPKPNNASTDWREIEYKECSEDWRHRDRLIWATLPIAATAGGVIVGIAYGQIPDDKLPIRFFTLVVGVILTSVMLISLIRHRMFQEGSGEQIQSLQEQLKIKDWDKSPRIHRPCDFKLQGIICEKFDAKLTSWASQEKRSGFKWMVRGTLLIMAIQLALVILTAVQWILN
jgi:hypothetical protein